MYVYSYRQIDTDRYYTCNRLERSRATFPTASGSKITSRSLTKSGTHEHKNTYRYTDIHVYIYRYG